MNSLILKELERIEAEHHIEVIFAVESGSRAWGFASPDSDYDVRFLYKRPKSAYLQLEKRRDTLEFMLPNDLDMSGWDLDKALRLLRGSNPSLIEWLQSPVVYKATPDSDSIAAMLDDCFSPRAGICHYLSMAKNNYKTYFQGETVSVKKYFYVLRPILAARYILEHQTPPPVPFAALMDAQLEQELRPHIDALLKVKLEAKEMHRIPRVKLVDDYMEGSMDFLGQQLSGLPREVLPDWQPLNALFCRLIDAS